MAKKHNGTLSSFLFSRFLADLRVSVWHISLYSSLLNLWEISGYMTEIDISRRELMGMAHIGSITTYHKCIKNLVDFGFIEYNPSYDIYKGSKVRIKT